MIFSLTVFSQKDMDTIQVKCFPKNTVKKIAEELIICDSLKEEHELLKIENGFYEKQVIIQKVKIDDLIQNSKNNVEVIRLEKEKYDLLSKYTLTLENDIKKQTAKKKTWNYVSSGLIVVLTTLLILK